MSGVKFYSSFSIVFMLVVQSGLALESLSIGDNVQESAKKAKPVLEAELGDLTALPDNAISIYRSKKRNYSPIGFLFVRNQYLIGVHQEIDGESSFLIDIDGDGSLDYSPDTLIIPPWVIADEYPYSKGTPDNVGPEMDQILAVFNGNANPYTQNILSSMVNKLLDLTIDKKTGNKDLLYSLHTYYVLGNTYPRASTMCLYYVWMEYSKRYDKLHPLLYLHMLEFLITSGSQDQARESMQALVNEAPDFVPGRVYEWQLEEDSAKKEKLYSDLKKEHPKHWIVKGI